MSAERCIVLDFNHGVEPIGQPESRYEVAREWICERCGHSFSEAHPTRMGDVCAFDKERA